MLAKVGLVTVLGALLAGGGERALASGRSLRVQHGTLTVDGLTVQTGLELRIAALRYMYIALPGAGTVVIAEKPFAGAREQKAAFGGSTLTVVAGERRIQLTSANRMRGTRSVYVRFDAGVGAFRRVPALSYGPTAAVPAIWLEDGGGVETVRRPSKVKGSRRLRTAKLCRPSAHGPELCATVREVTYKP